MAELIIGTIIGGVGLYGIMKGKIPFVKRYSGVKNIKLHSRLEGAAALSVGIMIAAQCFEPIGAVALVRYILLICILTLVLEIVLKAI